MIILVHNHHMMNGIELLAQSIVDQAEKREKIWILTLVKYTFKSKKFEHFNFKSLEKLKEVIKKDYHLTDLLINQLVIEREISLNITDTESMIEQPFTFRLYKVDEAIESPETTLPDMRISQITYYDQCKGRRVCLFPNSRSSLRRSSSYWD